MKQLNEQFAAMAGYKVNESAPSAGNVYQVDWDGNATVYVYKVDGAGVHMVRSDKNGRVPPNFDPKTHVDVMSMKEWTEQNPTKLS